MSGICEEIIPIIKNKCLRTHSLSDCFCLLVFKDSSQLCLNCPVRLILYALKTMEVEFRVYQTKEEEERDKMNGVRLRTGGAKRRMREKCR